MKKSEILRIIREEVQVVLTNEEAIEMFDLDPSALLDEFLNEEGYQQNPARKKRLRRAFNRFTKTGPNTGGPFKSMSDDPDWKSAPPGAPGGLEEEKENWIQDAEADIERRGTEGVCTGDKFGSESCPPGSKRYNLAKTFRKMAKKRKKKA